MGEKMESKWSVKNGESRSDEGKKESIKDQALIDRKKLEKQPSYFFIKRMIDIVGSVLGLVVFFPILVLVTVAIKLEDGGSVFFSQIRVGEKGKPFLMFKIRSMCLDAEERLAEIQDQNEVDGPMFKIKKDPRVTKVGKFIRRTSLDELPQLLNVLQGRMSLVGPRPPLPNEVTEYNVYEMQRLLVKPGCSGLWQISGRSNLHFDDMVKLDLEYIEKRSTFFDMWIIMKTFFVIFKKKGAY